LALDDIDIVKGMDEYCVRLLLVFSSFCHSVIEGSADHDDFKELSSVMPNAVDLQLWRGCWHEDSSLYLESFTAISDALGVVACTSSNNSSAFLLLSHIPKCSSCSTNLEASDGLQILSLEENIS
jgi:hypothetical protein